MSDLELVEIVGLTATALAVVGVWLNNHKRRECFYLWLVSNAMTLAIHLSAGIWSLALRDAIFLVLALHGLWLWRRR
jgi:nicotinamide riboside transporter PnuC